MKQLFAIVFFAFLTTQVAGQLPGFQWANQGGNPPNTNDVKTSLASGVDGSFYMAGEFQDTAQFGAKTLVSAGGTDVFLVKYTAEGAPLWSVKIGGEDDDYIQKIIADTEGNVIVAGYFYGTTQIGYDEYVSYGSQDLYVAKINPDGDFLWSERAGGPMADYVTGLTAGTDRDFFLAGHYYDQITIGDITLPASRGSDIFLARYNEEGDLTWANSAGGSSSDQVYSAACDPEGNILIAGSFYYDITIEDTTLATSNPVGVFIAKYLPGGELSQAFQLNGTYLTTEILISVAPGGDFYISGNFSEQVTFGSKVFEAGEFNQDIYIAKYNASCDLKWARHAYSYGSDQVVGIETDAYNNLYLAGHYLDTMHFDLLTLPYTLCCGSREIFITSYSAAGEVLWAEQISGTRANIQSIELSQGDKLIISGLFTEQVIMGDLSLSHFDGFQDYVTCLLTEVYTSLKEETDLLKMIIYPNPARDRIKIVGMDHTVNYSIYSSGGNLIRTGSTDASRDINISSLIPGQYMIMLHSQGNINATGFIFIKQK